jgi:hypothetical protein
MKTRTVLLFALILGMFLVMVCGEEETEAPLLESIYGYWKYYDVSQHGGCGSEDNYTVYWFKDNGTYDYLSWNDSYGLIKIDDFHSGTWTLNGIELTILWEGEENQVFDIEYTSESVILTLTSKIPSYTREYIFEEHPWIPVEYRAQFSLPAEDPTGGSGGAP